MSLAQRLMAALLPKRVADGVRDESEEWVMRCPDGHETSYWQAGGLRYKARSVWKRRLHRCRQCGRLRLHSIRRKQSDRPPEGA